MLRESGFTTVRPQGARRLYAVGEEPLREVEVWLDRFRHFWAPHLDALETELARRQAPAARGTRGNRGTQRQQGAIVIEVVEQINRVERRVGRRTFGAGEARTVVITRTYDAELEDVWDACTNPERIPRWFLPVSGALHVGGRYQLRRRGGKIERCDPPHSFAATWEFGANVSWIELRLSDVGDGRTRFELSHIAPGDDEHWAQYGPGAVGVGWELALLGLARHIASGVALDPAAGAAWGPFQRRATKHSWR